MWTIDGIRIFVNSVKPKKDSIFAELSPIGDNDSIIHHFGSKSPHFSIGGKFVGLDTLSGLNNIVNSGTSVTLSGSNGFIETVYIKSLDYTWEYTIAQTFDTTHACSDPVFSFNMEIIGQ